MAGCENISLLPLSEEYYAVIETGKLGFLLVDVALTAVTCALFAEECYFVVTTYKHFNITVKSLWLISIYPVFALSALLAVVIPRAAYICDFVSTCYLSACFFQFSSLILQYFGHVDRLLFKVKDRGFSLRVPPCCCCCLCCPVLPPVKRSLITVRMLILQTAILQPIIQFIAAVLWADDKYNAIGIDFTQSFTYVTILKLASTITAIYGLQALHRSTQPYLKTHNIRPKHLALQLVQVFFNIQGTILSTPARFNVPPCKNGMSSHFQMNEWHHLVLVVEMFLLSVLARILYRRPLEMDAILEAQAGNLADIYSPEPHHNHTEAPHSTQPKALPDTESPPQREKALHSDGDINGRIDGGRSLPHQSLQTSDQVHSMPPDQSMMDHNATQFHLTNNDGIVNPGFAAENGDKVKFCQTTSAVSDEHDSGSKQTSQEDTPCAQSAGCTETCEKLSSHDNQSSGQPSASVGTTAASSSYEYSPTVTEEATETFDIRL